MIRQNRPYSIQNILDNLRGTVPKKICETVLDALCEEKVLTMKEYGKAKIYLANQDNFPANNPAQIAEIDNQIKQNKEHIEALQAQLKQLTSQLKNTCSTMTNEQLIQSIQELETKTAAQTQKLASYQGGN